VISRSDATDAKISFMYLARSGLDIAKKIKAAPKISNLGVLMYS
jgi:hypothetical protein